MKKFLKIMLICSLFLSVAFSTNAQTSVKIPLAAGDTVVNSGTASKVVQLTAGYSGIAVQVNIAKVSGTVGGTVAILGSLDGITYTAIGSAVSLTNVAAQSTVFYLAVPVPQYVKVLATGTGTMSAIQTVYYRIPKYSTN